MRTADGKREAKARIALLGYLFYQMTCQHGWELQGLDLAYNSLLLQTQPTEADAQLWTSGVAELREALGVGAEGIMKIMRNIYGSTTAHRGPGSGWTCPGDWRC